MSHKTGQITVESRGRGLLEITPAIADWVRDTGIIEGVVTLFCRHTSASLTIQENADPDVRDDLERYFATIAPESPGRYRHHLEGPDDMPAHIRATLTDVSLTIPVSEGRMMLGTWQGIYLFEHRTRAHRRTIALHLMGA
ncbi:MAG: secondary thiamine-phosphate synthase enzyme YjbQ [Alphaproteobacteria bacterium]